MKRSLLATLVVTCMALTATAQKNNSGIHVIPRIGINFSNATWEYLGQDADAKLKVGFHLGADVEIPIADEFFLQPGLLFSTKGAKSDKSMLDGTLNLSYLEIPVTFMYKPVLGSGRLLLGAGPYAAFGVGGKFNADDDDDLDVEFKNKLSITEYDESKVYLKGTDFGLNLVVGYETSMGITLQLNSQLGLSDNSTEFTNLPPGDYDQKFKNTAFGLSVGYRF